MDRLRSMEVFVAVVEAGNFSAAAENLHVSSVMVGKHVRRLEEYLNTRLLNRSTRRQSLTETGAAFYKATQDILEQIRQAEDIIQTRQATPSGLLRVSAPSTLGSAAIAPLVASYSSEHPDVHVELVLNNERVDLIDDRFDLAVRIGPLADSQLIARPLKPYQMIICASPEYLNRAGGPRTISELERHRCLAHLAFGGQHRWRVGETEYAWPLIASLMTNDGNALRSAALSGAGFILQPELLLADDIREGRLVRVLDTFLPQPVSSICFTCRNRVLGEN